MSDTISECDDWIFTKIPRGGNASGSQQVTKNSIRYFKTAFEDLVFKCVVLLPRVKC